MNIMLGNKKIDNRIILVSGACRSGKTTLSRLLASCSNVEWIEEPYAPLVLLEMYGIGELSKDIFAKLFSAVIKEIINDTVLLRNGNFRPNDLSSIWNYKNASEIIYRLHDVNSRDDVVEFIESNNTTFLIDIPEISRFIPLVDDLFCDISVINVIRNGWDVADACYKKKWFTEKDIHGMQNTIYVEYCNAFVPWWISKGYEQKYLDSDGYERALMYWTEMNRTLPEQDYLLVKYESLCSDPLGLISMLADKLKISMTSITRSLCNDIIEGYDEELSCRKKKYYNYDCDTFEKLMERYGYEFYK